MCSLTIDHCQLSAITFSIVLKLDCSGIIAGIVYLIKRMNFPLNNIVKTLQILGAQICSFIFTPPTIFRLFCILVYTIKPTLVFNLLQE